MKKVFAFLLAVIMLLSICSAMADTDKPIQFSGHTFGETLEQSTQGARITSIQFYTIPLTTRFLADIVSLELSGMLYPQQEISLVYQANLEQSGPTEVAGHQANASLYFYYPSAEDSADMNLKSGVFYAGAYEFQEDPTGVFNDLKSKLISVYGDPVSVSESGEEIWGKLTFGDNVSSDQVSMMLNETKNRFQTSFVVWKSSVNGATVVLEKCNQSGWEYVKLYYIDTSAEEKITGLYMESLDSGIPANDSTAGL